MLVAEINGIVATSSNGNLVVTGIVAGKRANVFVGALKNPNGTIKAGQSFDGEAYVELNANKDKKGNDQYNFVMMVSTKALQNAQIRQSMVTSQAMADATIKKALAGLE